MSSPALGRYSDMWRGHAGTCKQCARVVIEKPATLAYSCIPGARIFKDLADVARRELEREGRAHV